MAKVYVGTYAKYNSGSIAGKWLDLEDYSDKEEFLAACAELHKDESDPELMFQDWEDIPNGMISESHISDDVWEWLELDEEDRELLAAYRDCTSNDTATIEDARDAFQGVHDTERDFAQQLAEDIGAIKEDASWPYSCIDWEQATRELMMDYSSVRRDAGLYIFRD
jgi:antirestriction protein